MGPCGSCGTNSCSPETELGKHAAHGLAVRKGSPKYLPKGTQKQSNRFMEVCKPRLEAYDTLFIERDCQQPTHPLRRTLPHQEPPATRQRPHRALVCAGVTTVQCEHAWELFQDHSHEHWKREPNSEPWRRAPTAAQGATARAIYHTCFFSSLCSSQESVTCFLCRSDSIWG